MLALFVLVLGANPLHRQQIAEIKPYDHLRPCHQNFRTLYGRQRSELYRQRRTSHRPVGAKWRGKTTAIKCLLGLLHYTGQIRVHDIDAQRQGRAARQLLGYVPQELAFYDDMSALDTAHFFGRLKKVAAQQSFAVLEQVGLAEHAAKPVRRFLVG